MSVFLLVKNRNLDALPGILGSCSENDIWSHLFFMCGLPGQKMLHVKKDINFVRGLRDVIISVLVNRFQLHVGSPAYREPMKYGVEAVRAGQYYRDASSPMMKKSGKSQEAFFLRNLRRMMTMNFEPDNA